MRRVYGLMAVANRFPWIGLPALITANVFLRYVLEQPSKHFWNYYAAVGINSELIAKHQWWQFLLPMKEVNDGLWAPLTFWVTYFIQLYLPPSKTWVLHHILLILAAFFLSWFVFHSKVFSYTLALCLGFGTQLYHTYAVPGSLGHPLLYIYLLFTLFCSYQVIKSRTHYISLYILYVLSVIMLALSYESWIDFLAFSWIATFFLFVFFLRNKKIKKLYRLMFCTVVLTIVGTVYIIIKSQVVIEAKNREIDFIFYYPNFVPAIEDFISNQIYTFYIAITNFLPPFFVSSNTLYLFDTEKLIEFQRGYHPEKTFLVSMHFLFLWRYYAGAIFVVFLYVLAKLFKQFFIKNSYDYIALILFMLMILTASPSHAVYKYRPYYSAPVLTYQVTVGVLGMSLLISYLLLMARKYVQRQHFWLLIVVGTWTIILSGTLTRPPYLHEMAKQVGVAYGLGYPDPLKKLIEMLGQ